MVEFRHSLFAFRQDCVAVQKGFESAGRCPNRRSLLATDNWQLTTDEGYPPSPPVLQNIENTIDILEIRAKYSIQRSYGQNLRK
jgi:hypothetical protein